MGIYLGTLGRIIKIPYVGSQQVKSEDRYSFTTTLEGSRKAQVRPKGPRTWALSADHFRPAEHSLLSQFADGTWGSGPFQFVSADAPVSNLLTPAASVCALGEYILTSGMSVTGTPPMLTPDGWAASSFTKTLENGLFLGKDMIPVIPDLPVTAAAYVRGVGGAVSLHWYDAVGAVMGSVPSSIVAGTTNVVRSWATAVPPAGAVGCRVSANSATQQVSWPSATWSEKLLPYGDGQGCVKAVVSSISRDQVLAVPDHTFSNVSFTVMEVG